MEWKSCTPCFPQSDRLQTPGIATGEASYFYLWETLLFFDALPLSYYGLYGHSSGYFLVWFTEAHLWFVRRRSFRLYYNMAALYKMSFPSTRIRCSIYTISGDFISSTWCIRLFSGPCSSWARPSALSAMFSPHLDMWKSASETLISTYMTLRILNSLVIPNNSSRIFSAQTWKVPSH